MADAALRADFGFSFGEALAHVAKGAIGVIGQAFNNHHTTTRAKTFVARWWEVFTATAFGFVDSFFYYMTGYLVFFGAVY